MISVKPVDTSLLSPHIKFWGNGACGSMWEDKSGNGNHFLTPYNQATINNNLDGTTGSVNGFRMNTNAHMCTSTDATYDDLN